MRLSKSLFQQRQQQQQQQQQPHLHSILLYFICGRETEGEDGVLQSGCRPCAEFAAAAAEKARISGEKVWR